jgi:hypothetical protein
MEVLRQDSELIGIDMALDLKRLTHFRNLMPMVEVLHSLLQPRSDQQTNDDGRDVDEKVFPRMDGLVGGPARLTWAVESFGRQFAQEFVSRCLRNNQSAPELNGRSLTRSRRWSMAALRHPNG